MVSKSIFTILALFLSFNQCPAEEPTYPYEELDDDSLSNQFIVEFKKNAKGRGTRERLFTLNNTVDNDKDAPRLIRRIESRDISVIKFRSRQAVAKWLKQAKGVKYFERGEKVLCLPWLLFSVVN